ncbi:CdaR family protein [Desulfogranum japonicum]|uniref:CdaR family protein n=1 Tax=Desulfogranum japonicum TaxID=231447 RepID=UPI0013774EE5|nr:CdaR family protein [Desulfogranum japonicum]
MTTSSPFDIVTKHWMLKLLSLVIGVSLWYFVVGEDQIDTTITVPIEVHNLPANLVIANQYKKDIEASIRAPRRIIQEVRQQNVSRPIDLARVEPGAVVITNNSDSIPFPDGITVLRLQPTNITLLVDELVQKDLPINPVTEGVPNIGYTLENIVLEPNTLSVNGPKSLLGNQPALRTSIISLDNLKTSIKKQVHLDLDEHMLKLIGEVVVTAHIEIRENILNKTVRGIPINVRNTVRTVHTEPAMVSVEAGIPEDLIRDTPELAMLFRASVDAADEQTPFGLISVKVTGIEVPGHAPITVLNVIPDKVRLVSSEEPLAHDE